MLRRTITIVISFALVAAACSGGDDAEPTTTAVTATTTADTPNTTAADTTTATTLAPDGGVPGLQAAECPHEVPAGVDVECGWLFVPENRSDPDSAEIALALAVVHPDGPVTGVPVVYLAGGPGGSALSDYEVDPEGWRYPFLEGRQMVLVDQRGTGYSQPTLDCPELADESLVPADAERACFDRLVADGIDISGYTTAENAADIADLRVALGVDEWNLFGVSYGTRLALDVMRFHPEGIRSVILDSPFPPNADTPLGEATSFIDAFEQLLADCESDAYCSEEYPDLVDVFLDTVAALNEDPDEITGDDLVVGLSQAFQSTGSVELVPLAIYDAADGDFDAFFEIGGGGEGAARFQSEDVSDSEGMYNSVICNDEYDETDFDRVEPLVVGSIPPELESALLQSQFELSNTCSYWAPNTPTDNSVVVSDIPTIVLVGQYDTATPPEWAGLAAEGLSTAYVFEIPGHGHSVVIEGCPVDLVTQFLDDPFTEPDGSCLQDIEWPSFE